MAALDSIGKYLGMFTDKIKIDADVKAADKLGDILKSLKMPENNNDKPDTT